MICAGGVTNIAKIFGLGTDNFNFQARFVVLLIYSIKLKLNTKAVLPRFTMFQQKDNMEKAKCGY